MLTRHGLGAVLLAVTAAVVGRLFGVLELFVFGSGLLALVVASVLWVHSRRVSLTVDRRVVPDSLHVGDAGRVELRIANTSRWGTPPLTLWEPVSGMGGATLRLAPLHRHERTAANYRLPVTRRGSVVFGPLTVERRDPFGLCTQRRVVAGTHEIVVLPAVVQLTMPVGMGGSGPLGDHLRVRALGRSGNEFHSLREYVEGDDLRQISWRASARGETLKVREVEPEGLRRCTIALDSSSAEYSPEGFERAVSAAAGAVFAASVAGLHLRMLIGAENDLRNTTSPAAMLALANCATSHDAPAMPFTAPTGDGLGLTIVVTGSPQSPAVAAARRGMAPTDVLVVIACSSLGDATRGFVVDATGPNSLSPSWVALTGSGACRAATGARSDSVSA